MSVVHPSTEITTSTQVEYEAVWVTQPPVEAQLAVTVEHDPPPSTGGQPQITITTYMLVEYDEPSVFLDTDGEFTMEMVFLATTEMDIDPVPVPVEIDYEPIRRVSITMPRPESFDRFGRPQ
jgi:hypothetical protein